MRAHVLQHVPFEGLGSIQPWLERRGARVTTTRLFLDEALPGPSVDVVIALGGPMSVNDEGKLPWLVAEKRFIREAIQRGTPTLGVCLGAQLIASSLGAPVYQSREKEIGWFPINGTAAAAGSFHFPPQLSVFHWHGETFDLPAGAVHLASSRACRNQAFQLGRHVLALQFHLETTPEAARALVEHCRDELVPGPYVQSEADLLGDARAAYADANTVMDAVLQYLLAGQTSP